jgi:ribose transport system permease protein
MRGEREFGLLAILLALVGAYVAVEGMQRGFGAVFTDPVFLGKGNMVNLAKSIGIYGVFSIAVGIIIIGGGIDLSIGSLFALLGIILAGMLASGVAWPVALIVVLLIAMAIGLTHGLIIAGLGIQPFVVTLCGLLIYRGLARFIAHDETRGLAGVKYPALRDLVAGDLFGIPAPFIWLVVISLVAAVVLHGSVYGRYLFAVGRNEEAVRYSGINSKVVIATTYVVGGLLVGIAAVLIGFYTNSISPATHGNFFELYGIAAAVLGGCSLRGGQGSILGILIGTVLIQLLRNIVNLQGIDSSLEFCVMGGVILAAVIADRLLVLRKKSRA